MFILGGIGCSKYLEWGRGNVYCLFGTHETTNIWGVWGARRNVYPGGHRMQQLSGLGQRECLLFVWDT